MAVVSPTLEHFRMSEVVTGKGGLPKLHVQSPCAEGDVYLHGANVASWKPSNQKEVLWLSRSSLWAAGNAIRGGVPICFPWFGPKKDAADAPVHGFVRLKEWKLDSVTEERDIVKAVLTYDHEAASTKAWFSGNFALRFEVSFGTKLAMRMEVQNTGSTELMAEEALHTYLSVGDVREVEVTGLEGERFLDKVDGWREKTQESAVIITAETDRVYMNAARSVEIRDPKFERKILIHKENSRDTVVWNPWIAKSKAMPDFGDDEWPGMICVETCNVLKNAIRLAPGERHTMGSVIEVVGL